MKCRVPIWKVLGISRWRQQIVKKNKGPFWAQGSVTAWFTHPGSWPNDKRSPPYPIFLLFPYASLGDTVPSILVFPCCLFLSHPWIPNLQHLGGSHPSQFKVQEMGSKLSHPRRQLWPHFAIYFFALKPGVPLLVLTLWFPRAAVIVSKGSKAVSKKNILLSSWYSWIHLTICSMQGT